MANIRIKDFQRSTTIADTDVLATDGDNGTKSVTWGQTKELIKEQCGINDLNTEINKKYRLIFSTTDLTGSGTIAGFSDYAEYIVAISASGYIASYHATPETLNGNPIFSSSYYYSTALHAMAAIQLQKSGAYALAPGMDKNSDNSSVSIYAR